MLWPTYDQLGLLRYGTVLLEITQCFQGVECDAIVCYRVLFSGCQRKLHEFDNSPEAQAVIDKLYGLTEFLDIAPSLPSTSLLPARSACN